MSTDRLPVPKSYGVKLIVDTLRTHEMILETIDDKMLKRLGDLASEGVTTHEIAAELQISYAELMKARMDSPDFNQLCHMLETRAASKHLRSARQGIRNPQTFSAAAYDRVMGALGFTPHVAHVQVGGASSDAAAEKDSRVRVGFDVQEFMNKHSEKAIIDVTPEPSSEEESDDDDLESIL